MDANIILGLGLYTIIGVAPLIYNYYIINRKNDSRKNNSIQNKSHINANVGIRRPTNMVGEEKTNHYPTVPLYRNFRDIPVIIFVLNKNNLKDPEIRKIVITYLMRGIEKEGATVAEAVRKPVELGVRDLEPAGIQALGTEAMAQMEA